MVCAVTNPDKPVGRDALLTSSPVKTLAMNHGIPVFTPLTVRGNTELFDTLRAFECDYFIVVAYGRILPNEILDMPKKMCINIHGSILPKYRGASPIQSALLHGEEVTGVTIMEMSEGMDEGDILKIREIPIDKNEMSGTLFEKFAEISGITLLDTLKELEHGGITPLPQDSKLATYCTKITKEDGLVSWDMTAKELYNKWQAYNPWPGIFTIYDEKRLLLERVDYMDEVNGIANSPGMVVKLSDGSIAITCSK